tara:strand:- start:57 stop:332 length:276 start_codon:yes stop_codon:yes gene_type:complete
METITKSEALDLIGNNKDTIFSARFIKKDGTVRDMLARLGVKKYLKGGILKYDAKEKGYAIVFDMHNQGYRTINSNTLQELKIGGKTFKVL